MDCWIVWEGNFCHSKNQCLLIIIRRFLLLLLFMSEFLKRFSFSFSVYCTRKNRIISIEICSVIMSRVLYSNFSIVSMLVFLTFTLRTSKELMLFEFDMYRNSRLTPGTGCVVYKCWRFHRSHKRCKEFLNYTAITIRWAKTSSVQNIPIKAPGRTSEGEYKATCLVPVMHVRSLPPCCKTISQFHQHGRHVFVICILQTIYKKTSLCRSYINWMR